MQMDTIEIALRIALVVDAIALIALVLIQQGKGASMGAAFGSGSAQTMFGSAGATSFLTKLTTWLAVGFFLITFALAWTARERAEAMGTAGIPEVASGAPATDTPPDDDGTPAPAGEGDVPALEVVPASEMEGDVPAVDGGSDVPDAGGDDGTG
jgi:preprotein translocase subunit SecG